jgi:hypothetical protein
MVPVPVTTSGAVGQMGGQLRVGRAETAGLSVPQAEDRDSSGRPGVDLVATIGVGCQMARSTDAPVAANTWRTRQRHDLVTSFDSATSASPDGPRAGPTAVSPRCEPGPQAVSDGDRPAVGRGRLRTGRLTSCRWIQWIRSSPSCSTRSTPPTSSCRSSRG